MCFKNLQEKLIASEIWIKNAFSYNNSLLNHFICSFHSCTDWDVLVLLVVLVMVVEGFLSSHEYWPVSPLTPLPCPSKSVLYVI